MKEVANPFEGTGIDPKKAYVWKYKGDVSKLKEVSDPFAKPVEKESIGNKILKITSPFRQIAWWVASSVGTFWAKAVWSALKWWEYIGEKLWQAQEKIFWLDQAITPASLKWLWQRTVERATQAEWTIQKKFWQDVQGKPLTEISKWITDIAQTVAIWPKAPTFWKAWISTIGKVLSKEWAKQLWRSALQWAAEWAIYSAWSEGKVDPTTVWVSAWLEAAFPVIWMWVKAASKWAGTFFTRTLPISRIEKSLWLTPTERSIVENTWETAAQFVLRKNIWWLPKEAQINKLQEIADEWYNTLTKQVAGIKTKSWSETAKKMLWTMVDEMKKSDIVARERGPYIQKLQEMIDQWEYSVAEKLAIKRDFDRIVWRQIFNKVGRVSGEEDKILAWRRNKLWNEIEKDAIKHGVDVKWLNTDVRNSITIRDWLLRRLSQENKNNTFSLQDIWVWAILSAWEPIAATALVIGKKALEKSAPWVMQWLYNLNKAKNVFTNLRRGASFAARDTSDGLSITPSSVAGSTATWVKALPLKEWWMTFQTPKAQIWSSGVKRTPYFKRFK